MRKVHLLILTLGLLAVSCQRSSSGVDEALSEAAALMEGNHEQAYTILESLDTVALNRRDAARYSLLKSMALDKKYIDLTTDSLIAPAVKYYAHHGSADDKLKTAYYHARILENAGESDAALDMIIRGEQFTKKAEDHLFAGRYYIKKSQLYSDKFEWDKALNASLAAERHSRMVDDYRGLATALLACSSNYKILEDDDRAYIYLDRIIPIWDKINDYRKGEYYRQLLTYKILDGKSDTDSIYFECLSSGISPVNQPYIAYTDYHISKGDPEAALDALATSVSYGQEALGSKEYELRKFKIEALSGNYKDAYESMSRYYARIENYEYDVLLSDTKIIEERINSARKEIIARYKLWLSISLILLLTMLSLFCIARMQRHHNLTRRALKAAEDEKQYLEGLLTKGELISYDMVDLLSTRIKVLNDIIIRRRTSGQYSIKGLGNSIEEVTNDCDGFIHSVAVQYSLSHPEFIRYLKAHDLSTWEIGFCGLFLMGLSGKEIAGYVLSSTSVYNISSRIRNKLGLTKANANLSKYLRDLFSQYQ